MAKKILLLSVIILLMTTQVSASTSTGVGYLRSQQGNDGTIGGPGVTGWAVMALAMAGQKDSAAIDALRPIQRSLTARPATDIERQILALAAAGGNPRTFESIDAIGVLQSKVSGSQIGASDYVNDDIFGVLAFRAARVVVPSGVIQTIISSQQSDGGWGITRSGSTSTDMTALALIAVDGSLSSEARDKAHTYLKSRQNDDGGFATSNGASNMGSTMWVDWMITSRGYNRAEWTKNGHISRDYITSRQLGNGSWENSPLMTSYGVMALSGRAFPYIGVTVTPTPRPTPTPTPTIKATIRPTATPSSKSTVTASPTGQPTHGSTARPSGMNTPSASSVISPTTQASPQETKLALNQSTPAGGSPTPQPVASSVPLVSREGVAQLVASVTAPKEELPTGSPTIQFHIPFGWVAFGLLGLNAGTTGLSVFRHKQRSG